MDYSDFSIIKAQAEAGDPVFGKTVKGELTERERHLIGLAVATTKGCSDCTSVRITSAKKAGLSDQVIKEAINLIAGMNAGFVIRTALKSCVK